MKEPWKAKGIGILSEVKDNRIRELEAELDIRTGEANGLAEAASRQKARAEKAEAELQLANSKIQIMLELPPELQYKDRAETAEARVAELEAEIRVCVRHGMPLTKDEVEAREREEG